VSLFDNSPPHGPDEPVIDSKRPLAERMRPERLEDYIELRAAATAISIPAAGVESLNAAIAAAVLLYEARRQRTAS
jgi:hypothetical protein